MAIFPKFSQRGMPSLDTSLNYQPIGVPGTIHDVHRGEVRIKELLGIGGAGCNIVHKKTPGLKLKASIEQ